MNLKATHAFRAFSILLTLNFILLISACWYILCFFKSNSNICVISNQFASSEINEKIKNLINNGLHKSKSVKISEELRAIFPAIKVIEKKSKSNCRKIIKIQTDLPLYQINNDKVLTSGSKIIDKNFYSREFHETLNKIYVSDKEIDAQEAILILKFSEELNHELLENYTITWHDKTVITFLDKECNFFYVKTEYETGFPIKLLEYINKLKEKIKIENSKSRKKKNNIWCADIRFGDKIVLTLKGEGEHEGQKFVR